MKLVMLMMTIHRLLDQAHDDDNDGASARQSHSVHDQLVYSYSRLEEIFMVSHAGCADSP